MKFLIMEEIGNVFWLDGDDVRCAPIHARGMFDTSDYGPVDDPHLRAGVKAQLTSRS